MDNTLGDPLTSKMSHFILEDKILQHGGSSWAGSLDVCFIPHRGTHAGRELGGALVNIINKFLNCHAQKSRSNHFTPESI